MSNMLMCIIIVIFIIAIVILKIISLNKKVSLRGFILSKIIGVTTYLLRNHTKKIIDDYKKINKILKWNVKEKNGRKYSIKNINIDGVEASMLLPNINLKKGVIFQLHGGGYEVDLSRNNLYFAKRYYKVLKEFDILTVNYRVAPENKFPAALEDVVKSYNWLIDNGYKNDEIIIVGDSAGGGLAIALVMYLRDNNIPIPKALITMSAWTDLTNSGASFSRNYKIDPIFGSSKQSVVYTSTYALNMDKKNPYISPKFGSYKNFPPMLMQVGENEMLLSDSVDVAYIAKKQNVDVKLHIYSGMFHIFQKYYLLIPEAKIAWKDIKEFVNKLYNK